MHTYISVAQFRGGSARVRLGQHNKFEDPPWISLRIPKPRGFSGLSSREEELRGPASSENLAEIEGTKIAGRSPEAWLVIGPCKL